MEKEVRNYEIELKADQERGIVEGYALLFNTLSRDLGGFKEQILPEALNGVIEKSDVLAVYNHNENKGVFARSRYGKGSLHLEVDETGLRYWFKIGKSNVHQELAELIERGDIFSSSFAFTVSDGEKWEKRDDGTYIRTITQFEELYDVSPVFRPAYETTTVGKRAIDMVDQLKKEEKEKIDNDIKYQEELRMLKEKDAKDLQDYYDGLGEIIKKFR